ncbi:MAG: zf-HC2 domain-containing protein [Candidatus Omnitrophica bacterium]|nr:zf-HC2 domain-containing protein [Candidatus Omnitrophota bacterium]
MNTCNSLKELILTDYLDGETNLAIRQQINDHLSACSDCRLFAQDVKQKLVVPFEKAPQETVPEHVWSSIKEQIEKETSVEVESESLLSKVVQFFTIPHLVPVMGSLVIVLVVSVLFFKKHQLQQVKVREQVEYLAYLLESSVTMKESDRNVLKTPIEQYFL